MKIPRGDIDGLGVYRVKGSDRNFRVMTMMMGRQ